MNTYCLKFKRQTKNVNLKGFITKNGKYIVKSTCYVCKFVSKQQAQGFLSDLFCKIPILNKII